MKGRVILQDLVSHNYLAAGDTWVASCQKARTFEHTYLALLEGLEHREKTQVVWCFQNLRENMYVVVRSYTDDHIYPCVTCPLAATEVGPQYLPQSIPN
jgi:hypothetical protein